MAQYLSNLPVGAKVKLGFYSLIPAAGFDIPWVIVAKNHVGYPTNSVTLLADKIVDLRCLDAKEPNNPDVDRKKYGNNRYSQSNLDQWLNSSANGNEWYTAKHTYDQSPDTSDRCGGYNTQYLDHWGFLHDFTQKERDAILTTTIRVETAEAYDGITQEDIQRKVFLPSVAEVGKGSSSLVGEKWAYFSAGNSPATTAHSEVLSGSSSVDKPSSATKAWEWWLRTPYSDSSEKTQVIDKYGDWGVNTSCRGTIGVRPAINVNATTLVSDITDNEGYYTLVENHSPGYSVPSAPSTIFGGKSATITWTKAVDPDGDTVSYVLECSYDGGEYTPIYSGTANAYAHLVPFGTETVQYRIKAIDNWGAEGAYYPTMSEVEVINNSAPTITGSDSNLGIKTDGFSVAYTVRDVDGDTVTVTEKLDGVSVRSYVATLGNENKFMVTADTWLKLANGVHTLTITAVDKYNEVATRNYTFTKNVTSFTIQNSHPMEANERPTYILLAVTRSIPEGSMFKVEVCNNGFDANPAWEDATKSVEDQYMFSFTNQTKTADTWGVSVRITVERGNGEGACYVSEIGGNFE